MSAPVLAKLQLILSRTGTAALDMISKISLDREETHLVPLVSLTVLFYCLPESC